MDMSLVYAAIGQKAGAAQMQIAATLLKTNADAERSAVQTLLGTPPAGNPLANVGPGVGGNLNVTA